MILQVGELLEQKQQHQPTRMATLQHLKMNARKRKFLCEPSFFSFHLYKSGWPNFTPSPLNWGSFIETAKQEHKHFSDDSQTSTKGFTSYEKLMSPRYKHHPKKVEPHQTLPCKPPWGLIVSKSSFYETSWWFSPPIWKRNMLLKSDHLQFVGAKIYLKKHLKPPPRTFPFPYPLWLPWGISRVSGGCFFFSFGVGVFSPTFDFGKAWLKGYLLPLPGEAANVGTESMTDGGSVSWFVTLWLWLLLLLLLLLSLSLLWLLLLLLLL